MSWGNSVRCAGVAALLIAALGNPPQSSAQNVEVEKLLELLVKKNVITQEEAVALREEAAQEKVVQQAQAVVERQAQAPPREQAVTASRSLRLSGYAQLRHTSTEGTKNTFSIRRSRMTLSGNLAEKVAFKVQADFFRSPVLLDANLDLNYLSWARVTIGQFKVPFSQENLISSSNQLTVERSFLVNNLVPGRDTGNNGRDIGMKIEGSYVRGDGRPVFDYTIGVFNGAGINRGDDNHHKDSVVRFVAHPTRSLWVGGSYYTGKTGAAKVDKERSEAEFNFARGPITFNGEYIWGRDGGIHKRGSYTQFAYRFTKPLEGVFRFEDFEPNTRIGNNESKFYLFGLNWYLHTNLKFQFNYETRDDVARTKLGHTFLTQATLQF